MSQYCIYIVGNPGFNLSFEDRKVDVGTHLALVAAFNIYLVLNCVHCVYVYSYIYILFLLAEV